MSFLSTWFHRSPVLGSAVERLKSKSDRSHRNGLQAGLEPGRRGHFSGNFGCAIVACVWFRRGLCGAGRGGGGR